MRASRPQGVTLTTLDGQPLHRDVFHVTWDVSTAQKGGYAHFMLKEIYDQPQAIHDTLRGRITETHQVTFPELKLPTSKLVNFNRIVIVACGTAYHAGLAGKNFYEHLLRRPVEVQVASEFRYNDPIVDAQTLAIIISQSGETADTLAALREAKIKGATTLALVNVVGSSIAREADEVIYTYAGPEICVASTKAYVTQLIGLYLLGLYIAQEENKLGPGVVAAYVEQLQRLPEQVAEILADTQRHPGRRQAALALVVVLLSGPGLRLRRRPGRRVEAQRSLLHPCRGVPAGRAEARPAGAGRAGRVGGLHRHAVRAVRQDPVQRQRGQGPRRRAPSASSRRATRAWTRTSWTASCASRPRTTRSCRSCPSSRCSYWPTTSPPTWAGRSTSPATWRSR